MIAEPVWPLIIRHLSQVFGREVVARRVGTLASEIRSWEDSTTTPSAMQRERLMRLLAAQFAIELRTDLFELEDEREAAIEEGKRLYGAAAAERGRRRGGSGRAWKRNEKGS